MLRICNVKRAQKRALAFDKCSYLDEISVSGCHERGRSICKYKGLALVRALCLGLASAFARGNLFHGFNAAHALPAGSFSRFLGFIIPEGEYLGRHRRCYTLDE